METKDEAVGGASGEVASAIPGGEFPMAGERAMPPRARDENGVEARRVTTMGEGVGFGKEASRNLVGEEGNAGPGF